MRAAGVTSALLAALALGAFADPPAWVETFPQDPDRFVGIGRADKAAHPFDYREAAQAAALAQISREISVDLKAETVSSASEDDGGRHEAYRQTIQAATHNVLRGYRLADVYETGREFWVLYTLDKDTLRQTLDAAAQDLEAWFDSESAVLQSDLSARAIQKAADRFDSLTHRLQTRLADQTVMPGRASELQGRYDRLAEKIRSLDPRLACTAPTLTLDPRETRVLPRSEPLFLLRENGSGPPWKGPLSLSIRSLADPESAACAIETSPDGGVDLRRPFFDCGLLPGTWRVTWMGLGAAIHLDVEASLVKPEVGIAVTIEDKATDVGLAAKLETALVAGGNPCCAFVRGQAAPAVLRIRARAVEFDSLEGLYFACLRGSIAGPALSEGIEVIGKGGHADKARAGEAAIRDFVREFYTLALSQRLRNAGSRSAAMPGSSPISSSKPR